MEHQGGIVNENGEIVLVVQDINGIAGICFNPKGSEIEGKEVTDEQVD